MGVCGVVLIRGNEKFSARLSLCDNLAHLKRGCVGQSVPI